MTEGRDYTSPDASAKLLRRAIFLLEEAQEPGGDQGYWLSDRHHLIVDIHDYLKFAE